ncbi:MAG: ArsR family transcriptional regulator, partial [Deltaproteobacteria bacterium]
SKKRTTKRSAALRKYVVANVDEHSHDIAKCVAEKFGISRQAANRHLREFTRTGGLQAHGTTRSRRYKLAPLTETGFTVKLHDLHEDAVWRDQVEPALRAAGPPLPKNVDHALYYGFTEILNNAIDHSGGEEAFITVEVTMASVTLVISDDGVGIFEHIKERCALENEQHAALELSKGRLTTDAARHTGEGIFFTSRALDRLSIASGNVALVCSERQNWVFTDNSNTKPGSFVLLKLSTSSKVNLTSVFDKYADESRGIVKTLIPVSLARYGRENLVSRSQAKRLLARVDSFDEVMFDFTGVRSIGRAFADEIFRVFARSHPKTTLLWVHGGAKVHEMIMGAKAARENEK